MKRLIRPQWYRDHAAEVGYAILAAGVALALLGVLFHANDSAQATKDFAARLAKANRENQQQIAHQSCVSAKKTRKPLLDYLESALQLNDTARRAHLLPPAPAALRRLQAKSLRNLRHLTRIFRTRQDQPCPPAPERR